MPVFRKEQIVGVRLGQTFAQMACYRNTMNEPEMVTGPQSQRQYDVDPKVWEELNSEEGDCPALKSFFENFLGWGHFLEHPEDLRIMVTVRQLGRKLWTKIPDALESLGIPRRCIFLQDYPASFFYYTLHQRKELWNNDVALLECRDGVMSGQILHIDRSKIPALCTVTEAASDRIDESVRGGRDDENWNKEKDRRFFELLKKVFERRTVSTCYLLGDDFDRSWAVRSYQYMCHQRHAFQGDNLYPIGACYCAMERMGIMRMPEYLFLGTGIVRENLGMQMRIRGKETYYPLVNAGINWYEVHHECEIIPDDEKDLVLYSKPMSGGYEVAHILHMDHFPRRPNRMSRLRLSVYFISPECAVVEAEDLGFGGFHKPSGKRWTRRIFLPDEQETEVNEGEL